MEGHLVLRLGTRAMRRFLGIFKDERGATAVEYGLILAMVFLAMVGALSLVADITIDMWGNVSAAVIDA
jgi:pilus assembly protein Flp/PilA